MESLGVATIDVKIGKTSSFQKFTVVDTIFPRVFLGVKTMKSMNILLDPKKESAFVNGFKVPFISGVDSIRAEN